MHVVGLICTESTTNTYEFGFFGLSFCLNPCWADRPIAFLAGLQTTYRVYTLYSYETRRLIATNRSRDSISRSIVVNISLHLVWSRRKIRLLFLILCACVRGEVPKFGDAGIPPPWLTPWKHDNDTPHVYYLIPDYVALRQSIGLR